MSAFALAIGSILTGLCVLIATVVYVATAASRVERRNRAYAGDQDTFHSINTEATETEPEPEPAEPVIE